MFFHIDESGNTGNNLFDANQKILSYGVLSSTLNVDLLGLDLHKRMLQIVSEKSLHANDLGVGGLNKIAPQLIELQKRLKFDFDYYRIHKKDYALVMFFDAVFDAGLNKGVDWHTYWTPMRYLMIFKLSEIINDALLKVSWELCLARNIEKRESDIVELLTNVRGRAKASILDPRSKELIDNALSYGIAHPMELDFGTQDQKLISPNAVCFQFVASTIASRARAKKVKKVNSIIVDQQQQFNNAQIDTLRFAQLKKESLKSSNEKNKQYYLGHPLFHSLDRKYMMYTGLPKTELNIAASGSSIGLQIVDVYLWIVNRILTKQALSPELYRVASLFLKRSLGDEISMQGMGHRFSKLDQILPSTESLPPQHNAAYQAWLRDSRDKFSALDL